MGLRIEPAGEAGNLAGETDNSMAGGNDGDRIPSVGSTHCARGSGVFQLKGKLAVGAGLSKRNSQERFPDLLLECNWLFRSPAALSSMAWQPYCTFSFRRLRVKLSTAKLGYTAAGVTLLMALLVPFILWGTFTKAFAGLGLHVDEVYSGGPEVRTIQLAGYSIDVHRPVFPHMMQSEKPFVQLDWRPANALPEHISDLVDVDGDGRADLRVEFDVPRDAKAPLRVNVDASFGASSWLDYGGLFRGSNLSFLASVSRWPTRRHSQPSCAVCFGKTGSFMPRLHLAGRSTCFSTWPAIPIEWPSRIIASSRWMAIASPFVGRTTRITVRPVP